MLLEATETLLLEENFGTKAIKYLSTSATPLNPDLCFVEFHCLARNTQVKQRRIQLSKQADQNDSPPNDILYQRRTPASSIRMHLSWYSEASWQQNTKEEELGTKMDFLNFPPSVISLN